LRDKIISITANIRIRGPTVDQFKSFKDEQSEITTKLSKEDAEFRAAVFTQT
jgi:hypothetical protein